MYTFQFHKGTIKTTSQYLPTQTLPKFQFHKGTIKTSVLRQMQITILYFNSIKVRLKQDESACKPDVS